MESRGRVYVYGGTGGGCVRGWRGRGRVCVCMEGQGERESAARCTQPEPSHPMNQLIV